MTDDARARRPGAMEESQKAIREAFGGITEIPGAALRGPRGAGRPVSVLTQVRELAIGSFLDAKRNAIFIGGTGMSAQDHLLFGMAYHSTLRPRLHWASVRRCCDVSAN